MPPGDTPTPPPQKAAHTRRSRCLAPSPTQVTPLSLLECEGIFDLGLWALQSFGPLLYEVYNDGALHQLPFITEELFETPLAGIDDIATVVRRAPKLHLSATILISPRTAPLASRPAPMVCARASDGVQAGFAWARVGGWLSAPTGPPLAPPPRSVRETRARAAADDADDRGTYTLLHALAPYARQQRQPQQQQQQPTSSSQPMSSQPLGLDLESISPTVARGFFEVGRVGRTEPSAAARMQVDGAIDGAPRVDATLVYHGPPHLQQALVGVVTRLAEHFVPTARLHVSTADASTAPLARPTHETVAESTIHPPSSPPSIPEVEVGSQPVEQLGSAVASGDFDGDGLADLAIGVPGAGARAQCPRCGAVRLKWGSGATTVLRGGVHGDDDGDLGGVSGVMARLGASLVVLDFNLDGVDDLAVGAPGESGWSTTDPTAGPYPFDGEPSFRQWGRVHVFLGSRGRRGGGGAASRAAATDGAGGLSVSRRVVLNTSTPFTGLGYALSAGDVTGDGNADLLIGCPSASHYGGRLVAVAASAARAPCTALDVDTEGVAALDISGPRPRGEGTAYGWFGAAAAVVLPTAALAATGASGAGSSATAAAALPLLLVGSPYHRLNATSCTSGCTIVGRVHGFALAAAPPPSSSPPPTVRLNASAAVFTITGSDALGRLGAVIAATSDGRRVAMAAPDAPGLGGRPLRAGAVAVADAASLAPLKGDVPFDALPSKGVAAMVHGIDAHARFGSSVRWVARPPPRHLWPSHAAAAAAPSAAADESLVVSAPFLSESRLRFDERELGAIFVWGAASLPPAGTRNATSVSATAHVVGSRPRGRFGAAVCAHRTAAPNVSSVLAVGAPRAGVAGAEQAGAVALVAI